VHFTAGIRIRGQKEDRPIKDISEFPSDLFQISRVSLARVSELPEDLLKTLAGLTDPDLTHLEVLDLAGAPFQDGHLEQVFIFCRRHPLFTSYPEIRNRIHEFDRGEYVHLVELSLANTQISDAGLAHLKELKSLERLSLSGCNISDEGLKNLLVLTNLQEVDLRQTKVTASGKAALHKALPKCRILL
jgi:Leucine-rich repeat (LRR) protein